MLATRPSWFLGGFRIVEAIGPILGRFLFRLGREQPVLELPILGAKRVDFLLKFLVLPLRLLEHALPVAGLLTQRCDLLSQLGHLSEQLLDQSRKLVRPTGTANRLIRILTQRGIHHSHAIPKTTNPSQTNSNNRLPRQRRVRRLLTCAVAFPITQMCSGKSL